MESFLSQFFEQADEYKARCEAQGFHGAELAERVNGHLKMKSELYFTKTMELLSAEDYALYGQALDENNPELIQEILGRYEPAIEELKKELIEHFQE